MKLAIIGYGGMGSYHMQCVCKVMQRAGLLIRLRCGDLRYRPLATSGDAGRRTTGLCIGGGDLVG